MIILYLFVLFLFIKYITETTLSVMNIKYILSHEGVPACLEGRVDRNTFEKSVKYTLKKEKFSIASNTFETAFLLVFVLAGGFGMVERFVSGFDTHPYIQGFMAVMTTALVFYAAGLPFSIYSKFVIEQEFGFNTLTIPLFFTDQLKSLVLMAVISFPVLTGIFWFIDSAGEIWWIYAFLFAAFFQLMINFLYPVLIAPVFNKFEPLEEGDLKKRLKNLADRLNFKMSGIFTMDGSKRSKHSNAYFTGFGKYRRIVLFDTLAESLDPDEIEAVLAHEIGHYKLGHLLKGMALSLFILFVSFYIIKTGIGYEPLFTAFGFSGKSYYGIILILSLCSGPFTFFLAPFFNSLSRRHEYQADRFAVEKTGKSGSLKNALIRLGKENLSNFTPHPGYSFFYYSHPALAERIGALEQLEKGL